MVAKPRMIDTDKSVREKPMEVLCLGVSRTGTMSMLAALRELGYTPYFSSEEGLLNQPGRDFIMWDEAIRAKFNGEAKPFGRAEFDKLLYKWDALMDIPAFLFVDELVAAYPDAKIVMMTREPDKWLRSMRETIYFFHMWNWDFITTWDYWVGIPWWKVQTSSWDAFCGVKKRRDFMSDEYGAIAKQKYIEHYEYVRKVVPKERLFEHNPVMGWDGLCKFLGKEVPSTPYPHVNDGKAFLTQMKWLWIWQAAKMIKKVLIFGVVPLTIGAQVYRYL